jgi:hypothetical protein
MMWLTIALVSGLCLVVNIPLGARRERARRFFPEKFVWIHASIPFIILLRVWLGLPPLAIPLNIAAAVLGQLLGGRRERARVGRRARSATAIPG